MQYKYGDTWGPVRGETSSGTSYTQYEVQLNEGEYIKSITGGYGNAIGTMHIISTAGRDLGTYGGIFAETYGEANKTVLAFMNGEFCLSYAWGDGEGRFRKMRFNYLYDNSSA